MDGVILAAGMIASLIALVHLLISEGGGTKGIVDKPYKTKSGSTHTAHKNREQHIVWIGWLTIIYVVQCALKCLLRIEREN